MIQDLRQFIELLRSEREIVEISCAVDPYLEAAEIHRAVIAAGGPALLFTNIKGSPFPLATNLFGTSRRINLAFGSRPEQLVREIAMLPEELMPPTPMKLWEKRNLLGSLVKIGTAEKSSGPVTEVIDSPPALGRLPLLTTWPEDGGPFVTLPLVYTEHPTSHVSNLGMYRIQRFDDNSTGLHMQIAKGGGFHLAVAEGLGRALPVNIHIGGPPALILSAIAPLPENVPELLLASFMLNGKVRMAHNPVGSLPLIANCEFALVGEVLPGARHPEGPFGDHYGYYSLKHDYPLFRCKALCHRTKPICTATVVGKPRQEDFYIGDYLQSLLAPAIKLVMPAVNDLWSYGETGYHSLTAAVVKQRYKREALVSAFRILGEGQLSLTKFLLVVDKPIDLKDFRSTLEYILARADFASDLYVLSNLSMDTLDYTGPKVNEGSKGILLGAGEPIRRLPENITTPLPALLKKAKPFCAGCLVVEAKSSYKEQPELGKIIARDPALSDWPLVVIVDDAELASKSAMNFLWVTFTRFEPAADLVAASAEIKRNHIAYTPPIVIDARMKPWYPAELFADAATKKLVKQRWNEYFPNGGVECGDTDLADLD